MLLMLPSYVREGVQVKHILKYKDTNWTAAKEMGVFHVNLEASGLKDGNTMEA